MKYYLSDAWLPKNWYYKQFFCHMTCLLIDQSHWVHSHIDLVYISMHNPILGIAMKDNHVNVCFYAYQPANQTSFSFSVTTYLE